MFAFYITYTTGMFNVKCNVRDGGLTGQCDAIKLGISRCSAELESDLIPHSNGIEDKVDIALFLLFFYFIFKFQKLIQHEIYRYYLFILDKLHFLLTNVLDENAM